MSNNGLVPPHRAPQPRPDLGHDLLGIPQAGLGLTDEATAVKKPADIFQRPAGDPGEFPQAPFGLIAAHHTAKIEDDGADPHGAGR